MNSLLRRSPLILSVSRSSTRRVVEYTQRQPVYDSPYEGPAELPYNSKLDYDDELYFDDGFSREYMIDYDGASKSDSSIRLYTFYFLGWVFFLFALKKQFIDPMHPWHPMVREDKVKNPQFEEIVWERVQKRRAEAERLGIEY